MLLPDNCEKRARCHNTLSSFRLPQQFGRMKQVAGTGNQVIAVTGNHDYCNYTDGSQGLGYSAKS